MNEKIIMISKLNFNIISYTKLNWRWKQCWNIAFNWPTPICLNKTDISQTNQIDELTYDSNLILEHFVTSM